jgi:uncharacterized membrane protein
MRSSHNATIIAAVLAGCGGGVATTGDDDMTTADAAASCDTSYLRYDNFGEPFVTNWCRGCHSANLPLDMRQGSPPEANFDALDDVRTWSPRIALRATHGTPTFMPPAGGPSDEERASLAEWLECGAP